MYWHGVSAFFVVSVHRLDESVQDSIFLCMRPVPPPPKTHDPDRFLKCQEAMADGISEVALAAIKGGWRPEEVAAALVELADNVMLGILANRDVKCDLPILRRK